MKRLGGWLLGLSLAGFAAWGWTAWERSEAREAATVFSPAAGCRIVVPPDAVEAERRAAQLLRETLAKASGQPESAFPIVRESHAPATGAIFVGATRRAPGFLRGGRAAPFDTAVGMVSSGGNVVIRSERRESAEIAASWFLEKHLGARWFMPGPLGEVIPTRAELVVPAGTETVWPGFISRRLGTQGREGQEWHTRNRMEARFDHGHNLDKIFRPEDLRRDPEMAPTRRGRRYFPPRGDYNWQPDLLSPAAIEHAAAAANRAFAGDPELVSFSLSENDSARFDDSARTLAAVGPVRYFRTRPDYSDLVFGFANAVAERVARVHPDRWLPTYAYYWAENTPRFRVARNVIPYLTADRGQWFDPAFAAEDRALVERWTASGAAIVGGYDYFYGAPFLVPRPLLTTVSETIPFHHRAGVRAFYAEMSPNWALDGPKAWLAAQLLWAPESDPAALLDVYYREFWAEAGEPMRAFFAACERAWLAQPRPGYWIKYFQDEHQALLFPPEVRAELRGALSDARQRAKSPAVRARVEFVAAGWGVAEAFVEYCEARDALSRVLQRRADVTGVAAPWLTYAARRDVFLRRRAVAGERHPQALAEQKIDVYLRNDPAGRALRALVPTEPGREFLGRNPALLPAGESLPRLQRLFSEGVETLVDPSWSNVVPKPMRTPADFELVELGGHWQGSGEPSEHRRIEWIGPGDATGRKTIRFEGCRQEFLVQWRPAQPGGLYAAEIDVRARVSPGNQTFLIVNFLDEKMERLGAGIIDRLPADPAEQEARLCVVVRAPADARYVGFGIRVIHQVNDDFAAFSGPTLRRLAERGAAGAP